MSKVTVLLENLRSLHNIGSIFRTADGAGVAGIFLTGYTATPPRKEISKTALGAELSVPWQYHADALALVKDLKKQGTRVIAMELAPASIRFDQYRYEGDLCLIVGNEVEGVSPALLKACDDVLSIPMRGQKESLNVGVAFGIAVYALT